MLEPSATRIQVWEALSELCLDTELQAQDFARISRILVEAGLEDAEIKHAWVREVAPVCFPSLLSVAGEWAGFDRDWLVAEITRSRPWIQRALRLIWFPPLCLPDWLELKVWIALRRASLALLDSELRAPEAVRRRRAVLLVAERDAASVASLADDPDCEVRGLVVRLAGGLARDQLATRLEDADPAVRHEAAARLAREAQTGDLPLVLEALARGDDSVRFELAGVVWRLVDTAAAIETLGRMLGATVSGAHVGAARACIARWAQDSESKSPADTRQETLRNALCKLASGGSAEERAAAVTALGWWQAWTGEAALELAAFARDPDAEVRSSAAFALGCSGGTDPDALAALADLLADEQSRLAALHSATQLGARAASLRPHVERLRHASDPLVRTLAELCAKAIGEP